MSVYLVPTVLPGAYGGTLLGLLNLITERSFTDVEIELERLSHLS